MVPSRPPGTGCPVIVPGAAGGSLLFSRIILRIVGSEPFIVAKTAAEQTPEQIVDRFIMFNTWKDPSLLNVMTSAAGKASNPRVRIACRGMWGRPGVELKEFTDGGGPGREF